MFRLIRILFRCLFPILGLLFTAKKYCKHKDKYSLEYRYAKVRKVVMSISKACKKRVSCEGIEIINTPHKGRIYIANHNSMDDILTFIELSEKPLIFISKMENSKSKIFKYPFGMIDVMYVDRKSPRQTLSVLKKAAELAKADNDIVIFPEGTRSHDGLVHEFKSATANLATNSMVEVVALAIWGTRYTFSKHVKYKPYNVNVKVLEPLEYSAFLAQKKEFNENFRLKIAKQVEIFKEGV